MPETAIDSIPTSLPGTYLSSYPALNTAAVWPSLDVSCDKPKSQSRPPRDLIFCVVCTMQVHHIVTSAYSLRHGSHLPRLFDPSNPPRSSWPDRKLAHLATWRTRLSRSPTALPRTQAHACSPSCSCCRRGVAIMHCKSGTHHPFIHLGR